MGSVFIVISELKLYWTILKVTECTHLTLLVYFSHQDTSGLEMYWRSSKTCNKFPKDPDTKNAWITATNKENWFPSTFSVICSRHFTSDCFEHTKNRRRLFKSAIPTLLLPRLSSSDDKPASEDEQPSTSAGTRESIDDSPVEAKDEPTNSKTSKSNEFLINPANSTSKKILCRKINDLTMELKRTKLVVRRLNDSIRYSRAKISTLKSFLEKLKNKELITQENIDIDRLQNSNQQLRKKVKWLKRLLVEQKKKNLSNGRNVVWCTTAEESMEIGKNE